VVNKSGGEKNKMTTFQDMLRSVIVRINDGTGFFISDTYIVTAYHVVESGNTKIKRGKSFNIYMGFEQLESKATLHDYDESSDIAVLRSITSSGSSVAPILPEYNSGDSVLGIGYQGNAETPEPFLGEIEGLINETTIKFSKTEVKPGLSGSPLLNERTGRVCGVVTRSRDTRGLAAGGYATLLSKLAGLKINLEEIRLNSFHDHFRWSSISPNRFSHEKSHEKDHTYLFPFEDPVPIRDAIVEPIFRLLVNGKPKDEQKIGFFNTAIETLFNQKILFIFGGFGAGKTVVSKELQLRLHSHGFDTSYASASEFVSNPTFLDQYSSKSNNFHTDRLLVVDSLDESYILNAHDTNADRILSRLIQTVSQGVHLIVNSRIVPSEDDKSSLHSLEFLQYLDCLVSDKLHVNSLCSIEVRPYDKERLKEWLQKDATRRSRNNDEHLGVVLDPSVLKHARNNLLHSCYNPLFAYIFSDRFYQADNSFDDIYSTYELFVNKTITGKFSGEQKLGNPAIKEIQKVYRTILQGIALSVASEVDLAFTETEINEWKIDDNYKRFVLPHAKVKAIVENASGWAIAPYLRDRLNDQQLRSNILACYFFEECDNGWRFRDNNILFFFLAEVLFNEVDQNEDWSDDKRPLTKIFPRFSSCTPVPIHPVAIRMWLTKLRRLDTSKRSALDARISGAYKSGKFLASNKSIEDSSKEFRLELFLALALIHTHGDFADLPDFFRELERLSKQLAIHDRRAYDVFRASFRHVVMSNANFIGHDLSGFNFSDSEMRCVKLTRCDMRDEVILNSVHVDDVQIEGCEPVEIKSNVLFGKLSFVNCPKVALTIQTPGDLSLEFNNCNHVIVRISAKDRSDSGEVRLLFHQCRNIDTLQLERLEVSNLQINECTYHTINVIGTRASYRIENSKCDSKKQWKLSKNTVLKDLLDN